MYIYNSLKYLVIELLIYLSKILIVLFTLIYYCVSVYLLNIVFTLIKNLVGLVLKTNVHLFNV